MAGSISRRKLAEYVAERLLAKDKQVIEQLAAYLVDTRKVRTIDLVVREIESALMDRGVLIAHVASTRQLTDSIKKDIRALLSGETGAKTIYLREKLDKSLVGGVHIKTPSATIDTTIKNKLQQLKAAKQ
ncbi:hypothetical protein GX865_00245 [Candidatus Saccharibacteria bacterium]|jgi:F-type H+-transporting ATPase subunit delta|nr:hypothetical protein [Candidatus Saccharibacteria bacterium]